MYKILKYCKSKKSQTILILYYIIVWQTGIYQILTKNNCAESDTQIQRTDTVFIEAAHQFEEYSLTNSVSKTKKIKDLVQSKFEQRFFQSIVKVSGNNVTVVEHIETEGELKPEEGYNTGSIPRSPPHFI
ncbi:MAG: hypothetical protein EHM47_14635 [Ignavibacteriales bacterium]|nr:MAG: hypothetical protein EHM47_14635 [Ignavibacteriales bacterium]